MKKLIYFHATWCPPCQYANEEVITPLEKIVGSDKIVRIDAQINPIEADKYKVDKLPTTIIHDDNKEIYRYVGVAIELKELEELLRDKNKKRRKRNIQ